MYSAATVANRFLELAENDGRQLTPMQILKLVYLAHGWLLGLYHRPLISERIEAWRYGPVIPMLYDLMRHYRASPVTGRLPGGEVLIDPDEADIILQVYRGYGAMSGPALSRLTHERGSPWDQCYSEDRLGGTIPNGMIEDYYSEMAQASDTVD